MDKKKLFSICASSNLLEANNCWGGLKENYDLSFEGSGIQLKPEVQSSAQTERA